VTVPSREVAEEILLSFCSLEAGGRGGYFMVTFGGYSFRGLEVRGLLLTIIVSTLMVLTELLLRC
jgi:hypothetical protein